jgi:hypothetical protein
MTSGGPRNRSGPQPDPGSLRSSKRGLAFRSLPIDGYGGGAPDWPLPDQSDREAVVWERVWRSPQADAWADEPWRWHTVAMYVRWLVRMEDSEASAALGNVVVRFADQVGMTPAGLRENGWVIGDGDVDGEGEKPASSAGEGARKRLRVV